MCASSSSDTRLELIKKGSRSRISSWKRRTVWSYYFEGNVEIPEICIDSLNLQCPDERGGCSRLHAQKRWHWQILNNNEWFNLLETQSGRLERSFQNVDTDEVVIPALDTSRTGKLGLELLELIGTDCWRADFKEMKITRFNHVDTFHIRRLSTPSAEKVKSKYSTEFKWFLREDESWVEFGPYLEAYTEHTSESSSTKSSTTSCEIEKQYQKDQSSFMTVNVLDRKCKIDFSKMKLTYKKPREVVSVRRRPRNDDVIYPTVWSYHIQGDVEVPEICMNTVGETCGLGNGCGRLHSSVFWHWQFLYEGIWYNMPKAQREALERTYLDVWEENAELPAINPQMMGNLGIAMLKMLGTSKWLADFDNMTITNLNRLGTTLKMRRLSTPSTLKSREDNATNYVWFFKNEDNSWVEFGSIEDANEYSSLTSSYEIEKCYESGKWEVANVTIIAGTFELNFSSMTLRSNNSKEEMLVRRRPQHTRSDQIDLRTKKNVTLSATSKEYKEVRAHLLLSIKLPEIMSIRRIQNPKLWKEFKKRQEEISSHYSSDGLLNLHTLFHWVAKEVVDDICHGNLKWRHQCPEVKEICNKNGVMFFRSAEFLHESCPSSASSRDHRLIVFKVLVGRIKGPEADSSGEALSTEVDNGFMPNRYTKYDKRDYCPEYIVEL